MSKSSERPLSCVQNTERTPSTGKFLLSLCMQVESFPDFFSRFSPCFPSGQSKAFGAGQAHGTKVAAVHPGRSALGFCSLRSAKTYGRREGPFARPGCWQERSARPLRSRGRRASAGPQAWSFCASRKDRSSFRVFPTCPSGQVPLPDIERTMRPPCQWPRELVGSCSVSSDVRAAAPSPAIAWSQGAAQARACAEAEGHGPFRAGPFSETEAVKE